MLIMTAPDAPAQLPSQAGRVLEALNARRGVWQTRSEIAHAIGKGRLNPGETASLDMLAAQGQIEARRVDDDERERAALALLPFVVGGNHDRQLHSAHLC